MGRPKSFQRPTRRACGACHWCIWHEKAYRYLCVKDHTVGPVDDADFSEWVLSHKVYPSCWCDEFICEASCAHIDPERALGKLEDENVHQV